MILKPYHSYHEKNLHHHRTSYNFSDQLCRNIPPFGIIQVVAFAINNTW